jgi:hypothetical protein
MHRKFPAIQQNQRNSILFHETIPLNKIIYLEIAVLRKILHVMKLSTSMEKYFATCSQWVKGTLSQKKFLRLPL